MATLRIICDANGDPTEFDNQYVVEYRPERDGVSPSGEPMICHLVTTPDREKALHLPAEEMFLLWRKAHGLRADGHESRPLTALSVEIS